MCRHLGYLGPARTLASLLYEGEHSMERQSYAPRMTQGNLLNADGYGIGWYEGDGGARRFRRAQPIWTDVSFREVAGVVRASCAMAALRSATTGFPVDESCAQPFRAGARLFSHNGKVEGFAGVESKLRELAGDLAEVPDARAPVDSALLFAFAARLWREGASLGDGIADVVRSVSGLAPGRYNLLASDGTALAATTWGDSLFVRTAGEAIWLASEPVTEEPGWEAVPERSLVTADLASGVHVYPL
ncbi:ergothioneine biosynthesis protein EgtC [Actinomadura rudentiformis]|uniref:Ergothioneine biosynthesis protein EgtC n=1 Tax=Actinomadura rudentiformis TaxID=359158 RepID=A0A6H9YAN0_9ACTN|nr:ergothioneine biosynthesis protein EgtC [Actinomadura rudentiformis]KAB2342331.1 ergothioneine biosynthesis protein EgtC [Actinomadura rudentiformis]